MIDCCLICERGKAEVVNENNCGWQLLVCNMFDCVAMTQAIARCPGEFSLRSSRLIVGLEKMGKLTMHLFNNPQNLQKIKRLLRRLERVSYNTCFRQPVIIDYTVSNITIYIYNQLTSTSCKAYM
jgi:hypothetical protein